MSAAARRIPARYVLPLLDHLRDTGADVEAILREAGLRGAAMSARGPPRATTAGATLSR